MKKLMRMLAISLSFVLGVFGSAVADEGSLKVHNAFSSGMVFQQGKPIRVWGWSQGKERVDASLGDGRGSAKPDDDGRWEVVLPAMQAETHPQTLVVSSGQDVVEFHDILIGDVWLVARQASVDVSLGRNQEGIKAAHDYKATQLLRVLSVEAGAWGEPRSLLDPEKGHTGKGGHCAGGRQLSLHWLCSG